MTDDDIKRAKANCDWLQSTGSFYCAASAISINELLAERERWGQERAGWIADQKENIRIMVDLQRQINALRIERDGRVSQQQPALPPRAAGTAPARRSRRAAGS